MTQLQELMLQRRSVRTYTSAPIPEEALETILQAGLLAPSGRTKRPWELIVVRDKAMLQELSRSRGDGSAAMLAGADCAIVVVADATYSDTWVEDCSAVMIHMHLMAESLGVGSCWIQGRGRFASDGVSTEDTLRCLLHFPENLRLLATLSLGMPMRHPAPHTLEKLPVEKIHRETF